MAAAGSDQGASGERPQPLFRTVRRGFDPDQVVDHVGRLNNQIRALQTELEETRQRIDEVRRAADTRPPYEAVSDRVTELVRTFDEEVEKLRAQANEEVDRTLTEARADAERIRREARTEIDVAREHTQRELADLSARKGSALEGVRAVRDRLLSAARDLEMAIAEATAADREIGEASAGGAEPAPIPDPPPEPRGDEPPAGARA